MTNMTIVLAYHDGHHPIVIGDLLVSGPEQPGRRAHVPTIGFADRVFPEGSGFTIVGLAQKVTIVADNCVVAWAGSKLAATSFVRTLRAEAETAQLTCDRLRALFSEVAQNFRDVDLSIVGAVVQDGGVRTFEIDAQTLDCSAFGPMHVAGSGVPALRQLMALASGGSILRGTPRSVDEAVARAFRVTGLLLQAEISSAGPLLQYFGGGYEVATFAGGRFQKVGGTTFVFWRADYESGRAELRPLGIVRQQYQGELLVLRGATVGAGVNQEFTFDDSAIHVVPALGIPVDEEKLGSIEAPEYRGTRICNVVLVRMRQGGGLLVLYDYVPSGESDLVRFLNEKERLTISFSGKFQQMIENGARQLSVAT